jgi:regulatory protein
MPVITALEIQKKSRQRVNLFIDDCFYCGLFLETVMKHGLKKGQNCTQLALEQLCREDQKINVREAALRLLDVRPRSRAELEKRLLLKKLPGDSIAEVLADLERSGLINDEAFAKMLVRHCKSKHMGYRRIIQELKVKGLSQDLIDQLMSPGDQVEQEAAACLKAAQKKTRSYQKLEPLAAKRRLTAYLLRQGFNYDDVKQAVDKLLCRDNSYPFGHK